MNHCPFPVQAALCFIRILRQLPEHVEDFMAPIMDVLKERHHGVLVSVVQLITSVVESSPKASLVTPFYLYSYIQLFGMPDTVHMVQ